MYVCLLPYAVSIPDHIIFMVSCANMAHLPQYWGKCHDVEGGATDGGQPRATFDFLPSLQRHSCVKKSKVKD